MYIDHDCHSDYMFWIVARELWYLVVKQLPLSRTFSKPQGAIALVLQLVSIEFSIYSIPLTEIIFLIESYIITVIESSISRRGRFGMCSESLGRINILSKGLPELGLGINLHIRKCCYRKMGTCFGTSALLQPWHVAQDWLLFLIILIGQIIRTLESLS